MGHAMRKGFIRIAQVCSDDDTWLVRITYPNWYDLSEHASIDVESIRPLILSANRHIDMGHSVIVMACVSFIGEFIRVGGAFVVVNEHKYEYDKGISLLFPGFSNRNAKIHHLGVMRWFLMDLCGFRPWKDLSAPIMNDLMVPRPVMDRSVWDQIRQEEAEKVHHALVDPSLMPSTVRSISEEHVKNLEERGFISYYPFRNSNRIRFVVSSPHDTRLSQSFILAWDHGWTVSPREDLRRVLGRGHTMLDALQDARLIIPREDYDAWIEQNVAMIGTESGDICHIALDIDVEPYLLLGQQVPYLWNDERFTALVHSLENTA